MRAFPFAPAITAAIAMLAAGCANRVDPEAEAPATAESAEPAAGGGADESAPQTPEEPARSAAPDDGLRLPDTMLSLPSERDLRRATGDEPEDDSPGGIRIRPPAESPPNDD